MVAVKTDWARLTMLFVMTLALAALFPIRAYAADVNDEELLSGMMEARGMGALVGCELLFDGNGEPAYAIGYSEDGYLIAERETGAFMEQGGHDPYKGAEGKRFYGGLLCYAVAVDAGFENLLTGEVARELPSCPSSLGLVDSDTAMSVDAVGGVGQTATVTQVKQLSSRKQKIKGVAFGLNAPEGEGAINNSCTAVALTIALNYLDYAYDGNLVDSTMELEDRTTETFSEGYGDGKYTKASAFHHHLVNDCGLGPLLGALGMWGPFVGSGVGAYLNWNDARSSVGLGFDWTVINTGWIEGSIDKETPALITIALTSWEGGAYDNHTMAVYGYRKLSNGTTEINLHSGWYDSDATEGESTGIWYMDNIWAPGGVPDMTYSFYLSDGWHCSGKGEWKYYEDELPVTDWKWIDGKRYHFDSNGVRTTGNYDEGGIRYHFNSDGVLVSQSPISSPFTGPGDDFSLRDLQVAAQQRIQATRPDDIPDALARATKANPDVFAWLYVPGTDVSVPVARREGDGSYYLHHDSFGNESSIGCAYTRRGAGDLSDAVTVLYGHSFPAGSLAFTSLHEFEDYAFFAGHEKVYLYLPERRQEYRVVGANLFNARAIEEVDQTDAADLGDYFAELSNPDPDAFMGFKRRFSLDAANDRVLQLSTCTVPADPAHRFVVTCVLEGEREL